MSKTVVLVVSGDDDFGAMTFDRHYNPNEVYKEMELEGVRRKTIMHSDPVYGDEELYASFHEFGEVDDNFAIFMVNEFMDYDAMKSKNFYIIDL